MKEMDTFLDKRQNKPNHSSTDVFIILTIFLTLLFLAIGSFLYFYDSPNHEDLEDFAFNHSPIQKMD